jgi:hypothetical protein
LKQVGLDMHRLELVEDLACFRIGGGICQLICYKRRNRAKVGRRGEELGGESRHATDRFYTSPLGKMEPAGSGEVKK